MKSRLLTLAGTHGATDFYQGSVAVLVPVLVFQDGFSSMQATVVVLAATVGVWLFYVQHQFETAYWARNDNWNPATAALAGSSHLKLPAPLAWWTAHIGAHHIHHAASRIPFYRLPEALREVPALARCSRMTIGQSLVAVRLVLWDEDKRRLVSFAEARGG